MSGVENPAGNVSAPSRKRILIVAREFTPGGAAYLALRHMRRLVPRYEIDFLVTGSSDERMLRQLPEEVCVFTLDEDSSEPDGDAHCAKFFLKHRETPPFQRRYYAALATSVFPFWHACIAMGLVQAAWKLVFLVDEGMAFCPRFPPWKRSATESCILAADLVVPVSRRLWQRMAGHCPVLARRPWEIPYVLRREAVFLTDTFFSGKVPVETWEQKVHDSRAIQSQLRISKKT